MPAANVFPEETSANPPLIAKNSCAHDMHIHEPFKGMVCAFRALRVGARKCRVKCGWFGVTKALGWSSRAG